MTTPLYLLLIPVLGLAAYFIYQQRQIAQQARAAASSKESMVEALQQDLANRDSKLAELKQSIASADVTLLKLRGEMALTTTSKSNLAEKITQLENENTRLREQIDSKSHDTDHNGSLFSTFARIVYDMVFILDADGVIIAHSNAAAMLFEDKNPIGQKLCELIDAPDLQDLIMRATSEEEGLEEQFMFEKRYYRARANVNRFDETHSYIGVALQDITQLVRLNRARRDMVANISHELGTPVANIRIIIDSLFHDQSRPKRKASIASLRAIARETESLQWTVQELLDLSMIESGQAIMKLVDESLHEIVDAAVERLDEKLDRKNIHVVRHIPAKMSVLCDRDHIRRVIVNLISNAIKWSPEDEAITISATNSGEDVTISVFDNGPGVPDDQRERIFERFYQVDTARSGREGSGLGLAISKHIVEAHGGKIWAQGNSQGGGGRFLLTLLNGSTKVDDEAFMDRGQHDAVLQPYLPVTPNHVSHPEKHEYHAEDEGEIEFVEDDELED